jgi:hypothetical protein
LIMKKIRMISIFFLIIVAIPFTIVMILLSQKHGSLENAWKDFIQQTSGTNDLSRLVYLPESPCLDAQNQDRGFINPIYIEIPHVEFQSEIDSPNWNPPTQPGFAKIALICNEKDKKGNVRAQIEFGFPMKLNQDLSSLDLLIQLLDREGNVLFRMERDGNLGIHSYKSGDTALVGILLSSGRPIEEKPDKLVVTFRGSTQVDILDYYPTKESITSKYSNKKFEELEFYSDRKKKKGTPKISILERGANKGKITHQENERRRSFSSTGSFYTTKQNTYYGIATDWVLRNDSSSSIGKLVVVLELLDESGNVVHSNKHRLWTKYQNYQLAQGEQFGFGKLWSIKKDQYPKVASYRISIK